MTRVEACSFALPTQTLTISFALPSVELTLGLPVAIDIRGGPDETFCVSRLQCNVPCTDFIFLQRLFVNGRENMLREKEVDLFELVPTDKELKALARRKRDHDGWDDYDDYLRRVYPGNFTLDGTRASVRLVGRYTGLVPEGRVREDKFNFIFMLSGFGRVET